MNDLEHVAPDPLVDGPTEDSFGGAARVDRGQPAVVEAAEQLTALGEIDRAAVVRVDQRVVPQFGALIDVGHPGHGELHQLLTERVGPAGRGDRGGEVGDLAMQAARVRQY